MCEPWIGCFQILKLQRQAKENCVTNFDLLEPIYIGCFQILKLQIQAKENCVTNFDLLEPLKAISVVVVFFSIDYSGLTLSKQNSLIIG